MAFGKLGEKFNNFFAMDDEDEYQDQEDEQTQAAPKEPSNHGQYRMVKLPKSLCMNRGFIQMPKRLVRIY